MPANLAPRDANIAVCAWDASTKTCVLVLGRVAGVGGVRYANNKILKVGFALGISLFPNFRVETNSILAMVF